MMKKATALGSAESSKQYVIFIIDIMFHDKRYLECVFNMLKTLLPALAERFTIMSHA